MCQPGTDDIEEKSTCICILGGGDLMLRKIEIWYPDKWFLKEIRLIRDRSVFKLQFIMSLKIISIFKAGEK